MRAYLREQPHDVNCARRLATSSVNRWIIARTRLVYLGRLNVLWTYASRVRLQSIPYFHLHLIPRWDRDGVGFDWTLTPGDPDRIRATAQRIRAAL